RERRGELPGSGRGGSGGGGRPGGSAAGGVRRVRGRGGGGAAGRGPGGSDRARAKEDRRVTADAKSVVVLDFGSQYTQLIARRIREARVFSVVLPPSATGEEIRRHSPAGIILSGGPQSVYE